ncbi:MAG: hypothetical protein DRR11_03735 [Gammaproteobacteria bacterium]|nr:MAG: hypothetical protein DRR11_03735 [Gammaproteobacteria bacterium]RLA37498.1 MAG: hypothetical protein DRR15_01710 [Gammaproteobacteria bacterium]
MKNLKQLVASVASLTLIALSTGCSTAPPSIQEGPEAEISFDGLHKVDNSQASAAWARPDFDISQYTKIMLVGAGIEYTPDGNTARTTVQRNRGGPYFMDDATRARFEEEVAETFRDEMAKIEGFTIVDEAGPDVLMVWGGLLDVTSYVPPDHLTGRSEIFLSQVGAATLVLELRDSESNTILARSVDRRAAERQGGYMINSNRVTNASEVRRLIRLWARRLRDGLDGFSETS